MNTTLNTLKQARDVLEAIREADHNGTGGFWLTVDLWRAVIKARGLLEMEISRQESKQEVAA